MSRWAYSVRTPQFFPRSPHVRQHRAARDGSLDRGDHRAGHRRAGEETTTSNRATVQLVFVGLGALVVALSQSLLVPVLSTLPADLHTSASNVSWLLTSTLLVAAISVPIMGRLGDMFGKRRMLLVALAALTSARSSPRSPTTSPCSSPVARSRAWPPRRSRSASACS